MRIISGKFGSRRISSSHGLALRPTSDRLRETLFDILQSRIENCFFIDAYAGTGAVGIEALSRGAARVVFLEKHRPTVALIQKNLESVGIIAVGSTRHPSLVTHHPQAEVIPGDVHRSLARLAERASPADILFFDPPYEEKTEYTRVLELLSNSPLVAPHTQLIFERTRKLSLPSEYGRLARVRTVVQGDAALDFFALS